MTKMRMVAPKARTTVAEERDLTTPATHEVRIRVHACGVCHSGASRSRSKAICLASAIRACPVMR